MGASGFTRRKVETFTLGERLRVCREEREATIGEVSRGTGIRREYLEYLEAGEYAKLPAKVYVRGYLKSIAQFLELPEETFLKLYEREQVIHHHVAGDPAPKYHPARTPLSVARAFTTRTLFSAFVVVLALSGFWYLYQEFRSFTAEPRLTLVTPSDGATVNGSEIDLVGLTDRGAEVWVNGQTVFVSAEGEFRERLVLRPGLNTVTITAENRFGKQAQTSVAIEAAYAAPITPKPPESVSMKPVRLEVEARDSDLVMAVITDGNKTFQGTLPKGEKKSFEAEHDILIWSNRANMTWVSFNDTEAASLGARSGPSGNIIYTPEGREGSGKSPAESQKETQAEQGGN